jgi:hypothetical protein
MTPRSTPSTMLPKEEPRPPIPAISKPLKVEMAPFLGVDEGPEARRAPTPAASATASSKATMSRRRISIPPSVSPRDSERPP